LSGAGIGLGALANVVFWWGVRLAHSEQACQSDHVAAYAWQHHSVRVAAAGLALAGIAAVVALVAASWRRRIWPLLGVALAVAPWFVALVDGFSSIHTVFPFCSWQGD
jgi:hypothetical protein